MKEELYKLLDKAYGVYSGVQVSAIIIDKDGRKFTGVNVENSAYPSGICAERNAIFHSVTEGVKPGDIKEVHIASNLKTKHLYPCAGCLQVMLEFLKKDSKIFIYFKDDIKEHTLSELVPFGVTKDSFEWE